LEPFCAGNRNDCKSFRTNRYVKGAFGAAQRLHPLDLWWFLSRVGILI